VGAGLLCCLSTPVSAATTTTSTPPATATTTAKNLLNNGNFAYPTPFSTLGVRPAGYYTINKSKVVSIPGWVVGATTDADLQNSAGPPDYEGGVQDWSRNYVTSPPGSNQELMMDYYGPGNISQAVATIPNLTYLVSWFGAGYAGVPTSKTINVMWDDKLVATPIFSYANKSANNPAWKLYHAVVTASSASSVLEFVYDPQCTGSTECADTQYGPMISEITLNGDAKLYLPPSISLGPTGPLLAVVRGVNGSAFTDPNLTVTLVGTWQQKVASYAPPIIVTKQLATATVVNSVATLRLSGIPTSMAGHTVTATATLTGPGFVTTSDTVKIKVT
jgi:hypothetical protein